MRTYNTKLAALFLAFVTLFTFSACDEESENIMAPVEYNDTLVALIDKQQSLAADFLNTYNEPNNSAEIVDKARVKLVENAKASTKKLSEIHKYSDDSGLYQSIEKMAKFHTEYGEKEMKGVIDELKKEKPDLAKCDNIVQKFIDVTNKQYDNFASHQKTFAASHNFTLQ